jgi:DedD protein
MEERNELNDIILNRNNDSISSNKKILLAVAVLAVILIVVVMIMKGSVSNTADNLPQAQQAAKTNLPPEPPIVQSNDENQGDAPLFQPVEIVKENKKGDDDLDKIAQKLKQESLSKNTTVPDNVPAVTQSNQKVVANEKVAAPIEKQNTHIVKQENSIKNEPTPKEEPVVKKESIKKKEPVVKKESLFKKETAPKKESLFKQEQKPVAKTVTTTAAATGIYYVQVGSFTKTTPSEKFFSSIKALGYAYDTLKVGETSKVTVGPFKNETDAREALKALRKNVESGAFISKK